MIGGLGGGEKEGGGGVVERGEGGEELVVAGEWSGQLCVCVCVRACVRIVQYNTTNYNIP